MKKKKLLRFLQGKFVLSDKGFLVPDGILVLNGRSVVELIDPTLSPNRLPDPGGIQRFNGTIIPGMVNAHCHLELSFMKNKLKEGEGLQQFILNLQKNRSATAEEMLEAALISDRQMYQSGIEAVGDICNSLVSLAIKEKSQIRYHSFIELFSFRPERAGDAYRSGLDLLSYFIGKSAIDFRASLTPHSLYSVSQNLMKLIADSAQKVPISIHMLESPFERDFLQFLTGPFYDMMEQFGISTDDVASFATKPYEFIDTTFGNSSSVIFVHNTFCLPDDLVKINHPYAYYCLCPGANKFIEKALPPLDLLRESAAKILIGTDSLASNHRLDLLYELSLLPGIEEVPPSEYLQWITINGANALGMQDTLGSFTPGKSPGVVLVEDGFKSKRLI